MPEAPRLPGSLLGGDVLLRRWGANVEEDPIDLCYLVEIESGHEHHRMAKRISRVS